MSKEVVVKGKWLAKILRHDSEGLSMNNDGFVLVSDILNHMKISQEFLDEIVYTNSKNRFEYSDTKLNIRARQGHSIENVEIDFEKVSVENAPDILYHGTNKENTAKILEVGLHKMSRNFVHLSKDEETAIQVGNRKRGELVILKIYIKSYLKNNLHAELFISSNGVYLIKQVDPDYIVI